MTETFQQVGDVAARVVSGLSNQRESNVNQALIKPEPMSSAVAPASESTALIHMIERAARDPAVDLDKLERLMAMHERVITRNASQAFDEAMSLCQGEMRPVAADANNPQTKSKYASYFALDKVLRPIYTKHGFGLSFNTGEGAPELHVRVLCRVSHGGYGRDYHLDMPADGKGAKGGDVMTKTHATGSALTYGQRYLLKMIFNIAVGGDDDGNSAGSGDHISVAQADAIKCLVAEVAADIERFCKYMKVERIEDILAKDFKRATAALESKRQKEEAVS